MVEVPAWYAEIAADEAAIDARIVEQTAPRCPHTDSISYGAGECDECHDARVAHGRHVLSGVAHADCPECVPAALIAPTPEPVDYSLPACER